MTFLASPIPNLRKGLNLKKWSLDPDHAPFGGFVMLEIGYAKVYLCTELEVSSFTRSKFMEGVSKFKNLAMDPYHAPMGVFFNREMGLAKIYPFTKLEVSSFTLSIF